MFSCEMDEFFGEELRVYDKKTPSTAASACSGADAKATEAELRAVSPRSGDGLLLLLEYADQMMEHCEGQKRYHSDQPKKVEKWRNIQVGIRVMKEEIENQKINRVGRLNMQADEKTTEPTSVQSTVMPWISVEDRLPEPVVRVGNSAIVSVLVATDQGFVGEGLYFGNCDWEVMGVGIHNVTHWMPLPKPPSA